MLALAKSEGLRVAAIGMAVAWLAGCTSTGLLAPSKPEPIKLSKPPAGTAKPSRVQPLERPAEGVSSAVLALMNEAQAARDSGNLEGAAVALERALRVQPRSALLWYRLAELRLQQEKPQMAVDLALKSKLLAGSDRALVRQNWALIAQAKHSLGDEEGAAAAERQAVGEP